jgi:hypothetical protein
MIDAIGKPKDAQRVSADLRVHGIGDPKTSIDRITPWFVPRRGLTRLGDEGPRTRTHGFPWRQAPRESVRADLVAPTLASPPSTSLAGLAPSSFPPLAPSVVWPRARLHHKPPLCKIVGRGLGGLVRLLSMLHLSLEPSWQSPDGGRKVTHVHDRCNYLYMHEPTYCRPVRGRKVA